MISPMLRAARRFAVLIIGSTVLLIGVIMIVTPGPAIVVIPAGLAILATEFVWAERMLKHIKDKAVEVTDRIRGKVDGPSQGSSRPA
jgi:tellurite resistance protein TerC